MTSLGKSILSAADLRRSTCAGCGREFLSLLVACPWCGVRLPVTGRPVLKKNLTGIHLKIGCGTVVVVAVVALLLLGFLGSWLGLSSNAVLWITAALTVVFVLLFLSQAVFAFRLYDDRAMLLRLTGWKHISFLSVAWVHAGEPPVAQGRGPRGKEEDFKTIHVHHGQDEETIEMHDDYRGVLAFLEDRCVRACAGYSKELGAWFKSMPRDEWLLLAVKVRRRLELPVLQEDVETLERIERDATLKYAEPEDAGDFAAD